MDKLKEIELKYHKYIVDINNFKQPEIIGWRGNVFKVQNIQTKQELAAKILTPNYDHFFYRNASREIGNMIYCQHPTIIKCFGFSLNDFYGRNYITIFMEYEPKGSLHSILHEKKEELDNTQKQIILIGIARGMLYLHRNAIIHRDLKSGNILLDKDYHPKIIDFGCSKIFKRDSVMKQSCECGTPIYVAPEITNNSPIDNSIDVYSFGILMYEILTNFIPYEELNETAYTLEKF